MPEDLDHQYVIDVTMDDLDEEQKKLVQANVDNYMKLCLESFGKIRNKVVQKEQLPNSSITVAPIDGSAGETSAQSFQETVDAAVHDALIRGPDQHPDKSDQASSRWAPAATDGTRILLYGSIGSRLQR